MMGANLAGTVELAMARRHALDQQRKAAAVVLERYGAVEGVERWAHSVLRCDEPQGYRLLFRLADRGVS